MLTLKDWERMRRMYHVEGKSLREIERETGHAFRTVKRAVESEEAPVYKRKSKKREPVLGPYKGRIVELLEESKKLPRKQRYTSSKVYEIVRREGYKGAESTLRHHISKVRKRERRPKVYLPLSYEVGEDGQVDWGEGYIIYRGEPMKVQLLVIRLSYSRRLFVQAYPRAKQECFFDGQVKGFEFFGGVPKRITYDNLKSAVKRVLEGKKREEQESFLKFRGYYAFESHFCAPGAGNEKGIVEDGVGYVQRKYLSPLPEVESWSELNGYLYRRCQEDDSRTVSGQPRSIGEMWSEEQPYLRPLPERRFSCYRTIEATLTPYSQVIVETNRYSVPVEKAEDKLVIKLYPFQVKICSGDGGEELAVHERNYEKEQDIFNPLHYLSLLSRRPGALGYAKPIRQWRQELPVVYEELLAHLQEKWPDGKGVREFIAVLQLHLAHPAEEIGEAVGQALEYGCAHADGVQFCLNQILHPGPEVAALDLSQRPHLSDIGEQPLDFTQYDAFFFGETQAESRHISTPLPENAAASAKLEGGAI